MGKRRRTAAGRLPILPVVIWVVVLAMAIASPLLAPHDPASQELTARLLPPAWEPGGTSEYLLGTDHLGRDILSRLIYGSRVTVIVVITAITAAGLIGVFVGMCAGYFGRRVDAVLMRLVDFQVALPALLFGVMLAAVLEPGLRNVVIIIIVFTWAGFARLVRAEVLTLRNVDFVLLSRAAGASWLRIFKDHLLPNVLNTIMVLATLELSVVILFEAALSFLGLGISPPAISWGQMLADGRQVMSVAWWPVAIPGITIFAVALSGNLSGDWLRDRLDPRLRRSVET